MKTDEEAIRELVSERLRATEAGESNKVIALMADDVVFLTTGSPPMLGRDAFAASKAAMTGVRIMADSNIQEIEVLDGYAYLWAQLTVILSPPDAEPIKRTGNTVSIPRKQSRR